MQARTDNASHDAKKFPLCAPWNGEKGAPFERFFNDFPIAGPFAPLPSEAAICGAHFHAEAYRVLWSLVAGAVGSGV